MRLLSVLSNEVVEEDWKVCEVAAFPIVKWMIFLPAADVSNVPPFGLWARQCVDKVD